MGKPNIKHIPQNMHTAVLLFVLSWMYSNLIHMIYLPIYVRVTSLTLGQPLDCPSASEVILNDMGKIDWYQTATIHKKARTIRLTRRMYGHGLAMYCFVLFGQIFTWIYEMFIPVSLMSIALLNNVVIYYNRSQQIINCMHSYWRSVTRKEDLFYVCDKH